MQGREELLKAHAEPLSNVLMVQLVRSSKRETQEGLSGQKPKKLWGSEGENAQWRRPADVREPALR